MSVRYPPRTGVCWDCGKESSIAPSGQPRARCVDCQRKVNTYRTKRYRNGQLARSYIPMPDRPKCECSHYLSLHVMTGCVACECEVVGDGQPDHNVVYISVDRLASHGVQVA